ncbi:MAG: hypothetical protein WDN08_11135 [Rhizomicrobium sp.]
MADHQLLDRIGENVQALTDYFVRRRRFFTPLLAIVAAAIAVPLAVLFSLPTILSWFAAPLDMSQGPFTPSTGRSHSPSWTRTATRSGIAARSSASG